MIHKRLLTKPREHPGEQGALLVEALVVSVVVTIALLGTIGLINISTQQRNRAAERNQLNAAIDADVAVIQDLASQLTCCTGACTLGIAGVPTTDGGTPNVPCATNNRRDDRYFYPQLDTDPNTAGSEAQTVDGICAEPNRGIISDAVLAQFNALAVNADLTASGGARQPIVRLNAVQNQPGNQNILQVTYTEGDGDNAVVVRVARVVPPMARFCP